MTVTSTLLSLCALACGTLLLVGVLWDAFETMILSRRVSRGVRVTTLFYRATWRPWAAVARRRAPGRRRESFLTVYGPLSLVFLIALWAVSLVFAFALLHWGGGDEVTGPGGRGFWTTVYMSGTTLFTLGLGDVTPKTTFAKFLTVAESGTGFAFLALVISYLPVLSTAFSRREVSIAMLDARAGSPPTCSELLRRHGLDRAPDALAILLEEWERWSAELLESHISFPVLAFYRSQHDNQSWVAALTTILDSCALVIAAIPEGPVRGARLTFAMARHAVADMCNVLGQRPHPPQTDRLPHTELTRLRQTLELAGVRWEAGEKAERQLAELRAMYEGHVNALAEFLVMPLPRWLPPAPARDNWQMTGRLL
jgi:Ion channel